MMYYDTLNDNIIWYIQDAYQEKGQDTDLGSTPDLGKNMETMFLQLFPNRTELSTGEYVVEMKQRRKRIKKMKNK